MLQKTKATVSVEQDRYRIDRLTHNFETAFKSELNATHRKLRNGHLG